MKSKEQTRTIELEHDMYNGKTKDQVIKDMSDKGWTLAGIINSNDGHGNTTTKLVFTK